MAVSNLLRLVVHWSGYGEEGTVSAYFGGSAATHTNTQLSAAAAAAVTAGTGTNKPLTDLASNLTTQQVIDKLTVYEYATAPGPATGVGIATAAINGTVSTSISGLQQAIAITEQTPQAGRSFRGRSYYPAHTAGAQLSNAQLTTSQCQGYANLWKNFLNTFTSSLSSSLSIATVVPVVYSPTRGLATGIVSTRCDSRLDTQRRRAKQQKPATSYTATV